MVYLVIMSAVLLVFILLVALLLILPSRNMKSNSQFSAAPMPKGTIASVAANSTALDQTPTVKQRSQRQFGDNLMYADLTDDGATRTPNRTHVTGPVRRVSPLQSNAQSSPGIDRYAHSPQEPNIVSSPLLPSSSEPIHGRRRYELELEYERGMRTIYDEQVGAINFIGMHVVMNTPAEVELAFHVCKRQIRSALRARGLERAPTLTDIGGIVIGRDATAAWGQALKDYLEEMCIKVGNDTYLLAHYNSQADQPDHSQLQEKIRRIQFMTAAAINHFQSNIFDTREEAAAFLQRMRQVYRV